MSIPHVFPSRAVNIRAARTEDEIQKSLDEVDIYIYCSSNILCLFITANSKNVFTYLQLGHLCSCPESCVVHIAQHRIGIARISCVDCSFVLTAISQMMEMMEMMIGIIVFHGIRERNEDSEGRVKKLTDNSNPMVRASFLTSSRSNSMDGSLVLLFSQCHNKGPGPPQPK